MARLRVPGWLLVAVAVTIAGAIVVRGALPIVLIAAAVVSAWLAGRAMPARATPAVALPPPASGADVLGDLERVLDPLSEAVILLDVNLVVHGANRAAVDLAGRPRDALLGQALIRVLRDHDVVQIARERTGEARLVGYADARELRVIAAPIALPPVTTILVIEDRTAMTRAQRARADLVANISHELRTPLAAARALAETLQSGVDDPAAHAAFAGRLVGEVDRLGDMVNRLLRLARLDAGSEQFVVEPLDAGALLREAASRLAPLAEQRGVTITVAAGNAWAALGDRERVLEVLANLIDNALRYAPDRGAVTLAVDAAGGDVRFAVHDDGPGILPADRERIFERFYTADAARAAGQGAGLGLAIARNIVGRLGGRIWVEPVSAGTTLCFTLPAAGDRSTTTDGAGGAPAPR